MITSRSLPQISGIDQLLEHMPNLQGVDTTLGAFLATPASVLASLPWPSVPRRSGGALRVCCWLAATAAAAATPATRRMRPTNADEGNCTGLFWSRRSQL